MANGRCLLVLSVVFWSRKTFPSNAPIQGGAALVWWDVNHSFENILLAQFNNRQCVRSENSSKSKAQQIADGNWKLLI